MAAVIISIVACSGGATAKPASPTGTPAPNSAEATTAGAPTGAPASALPPTTALAAADIVFTNGSVITMDDAQPQANALAVLDDKILAVGTNDEIAKYRGAGTIVVDLKGRTLVPGFIDAHQYRIQKRANVGIADAGTSIQRAVREGWTSLHELYVDQPLLNELLALDQAGTLRVRIDAYLPFMEYNAAGTKLGEWYAAYHQGQVLSPHLRVAGLIGFADYDNARVLLWTQDDLNAFLLKAQREGWVLATKTVSTRSLEMILDAYEYVRSSDPKVVASRGRLEHALFMAPDQIPRIKQLGLIPIINLNNPGQLVGEQDVDEFITREPKGSYTPWRALEKAGVIVANGSGWPSYYVDEPTGAPFGSPLHLMYQGITRVGNLGKKPYPWLLDQTISAQEALRALTINSAYAAFEEDATGSLQAGKLADMVILSDNPLTVSTEQINSIRVLMTMIGGKAEYCAAEYDNLCSSTRSSGAAPASTAQATYPSATASAFLPGSPPSNALDGDLDTIWGAGADPVQWIQMDLGQPATVSTVRLTISQYPSGETIHQLWGGKDAGSLVLLHEFKGVTADPNVLEFKPPAPLAQIRYIRVVTTQSPSWVGWREIEIVRTPGG
jgi:hypothetical protein